MRLRHECAAAALIALASCRDGRSEGSERDFRGVYTFGFEASAFRQCGLEEHWDAPLSRDAVPAELEAFTDTARALRPFGAGQPSGDVYMEVRGRLGEPHMDGQLGERRELRILEIRRWSPRVPAGC